MVSIVHAVTGAFIASVLPHPVLYVPLAVCSHFALDYVRHYDIGVAMKKYHFKKWQIVFWETIDLAIAVALIIWLFQQSPTHICANIWTGALAGILPDVIETSDYFFQKPLPVFRPFYYFHERFHHSTQNWWWGSWPQILLVCCIIYLTLN